MMRRTSRISAALLGAALLLVVGCAGNKGPIYYWGSYEQILYDMYENPGKADPGTQITKLTHDIEKAKWKGKRVAPGVHGHLGYIYASQGRLESAAEEFALEKELFPESSHFVDGILDRMRR